MEGASSVISLLIRKPNPWEDHSLISSNPNYLSEAPSPNTLTLEVRVSTLNLGWGTHDSVHRACECDLIWQKVFADIKDLELRPSWIIQMGSKSNGRYLHKRKAGENKNTWRKGHASTRQKSQLWTLKPRNTRSQQKLEEARAGSP